ncbi:NAD(P)-binding protein, partial [Ceraceosorus guamensis]
MSSAVPETSLPTPENPGRLASAATIVAPFQKQISDANAARLDTGKRKAKLVGILATPSGPSVAYAEWTKKACEAVGIEFEIWKTWDDSEAPINGDDEPMNGGTSEQSADVELEGDVEDLIIAANADAKVHGIMIYYPIFGGRQDTYLQQIVDPRKDVEGLHFSYCWNMYHNVRWISPKQLGGAPGTVTEPRGGNLSPTMRRLSLSSPDGASAEEAVPKGFAKSILPCTPLAIVKCLEALGVYDTSLPYGDRLYGKTITVVNRSEVVGRPLAALLSNDGAKVYSVDIGSVQEFNKRGGAIARAETLSGGDETSQAGRKRSSVVLEARAANSSRRLRPHHIVRPCSLDLEACVGASNVIISGVPSANFKIPTAWVPRGATTVNFSSEKNFEKDVRTRAALHLPAVGKMTIAMLQRNLLRLVEYRELTDADT